MPTPTRVLDVPEVPPREWFTADSPDFAMGQSLQVVVTGPDEGRAFGLIQPPPDHSAYMPGARRNSRSHRNFGRRPPDARYYPDNMAVFNRGPIQVTNPDGTIGAVAGGRLPLFGGHAGAAIGAQNITEAVEWLHREGRWTAQADALGLVGVATPVTEPGYEGAVMFRGAALPGMTAREALTINSTSVSAEVWEDPQYGNELVFAGAIVCDHTAWPYHQIPEALAAATDDNACDGVYCTVYPLHDPTPEATPVPPAATETATEPAVPPMVAAAVTDADLDILSSRVSDVAQSVEAMNGRLDEFDKALEDVTVELAEIGVTVFGVESINELDALARRLAEMEELIERLKEDANQPPPTVESPENQTSTRTAINGLTAPSSSIVRNNLQPSLRG